MAASITTRTRHEAKIPWADVISAVVENEGVLTAMRPVLANRLSTNGVAALTLTYEVTVEGLDPMLRAAIPGLPTLGTYLIEPLPADPNDAFVVSWETTQE